MKLGKPLSIFGEALQSPTGTPVVALDADNKPIAFGLHLSTDPAKRAEELAQAKHSFLDDAAQYGKYAHAATVTLDSFAALHPAGSDQLVMGSTAIAFISNGVGLAAAVKSGDDGRIVVKTIAIGIDALSLAQQFGLLGQSPTVQTAIVIAKNVSAFVDLVEKPDPPVKLTQPPRRNDGEVTAGDMSGAPSSGPSGPVSGPGSTTVGGPGSPTAGGVTTSKS